MSKFTTLDGIFIELKGKQRKKWVSIYWESFQRQFRIDGLLAGQDGSRFRAWSAWPLLMASRHRMLASPCTRPWSAPPRRPPPPPSAGSRCSRQTRPLSCGFRTPRAPFLNETSLKRRENVQCSYPKGSLHQHVQLWTRDLKVIPEDEDVVYRILNIDAMMHLSMIPQGLMTRHHQFSHRVKVSFHESLSCWIGSGDKRVLRNKIDINLSYFSTGLNAERNTHLAISVTTCRTLL